MQVNYKSAEKYVGSDELELLVLFPAGFIIWRWRCPDLAHPPPRDERAARSLAVARIIWAYSSQY
jgi:hypothetical protein